MKLFRTIQLYFKISNLDDNEDDDEEANQNVQEEDDYQIDENEYDQETAEIDENAQEIVSAGTENNEGEEEEEDGEIDESEQERNDDNSQNVEQQDSFSRSNLRSHSFSKLNHQIQEAMNEANSLELSNNIELLDRETNSPYETLVDNEMNEYDLTENDSLIEDFNIELGTSKLPRFSCPNHKLNIVSRTAIKECLEFSSLLRKLSKLASKINRSVNRNVQFIEKKARLRCENATRWSSTFLMLLCFIKAYRKGLFDDDEDWVFDIKEIEEYYQILRPLYIVSLFFSKNKCFNW